MSFSDRIGITKARDVMQIDDVDSGLTNKLWNLIQIYIFEEIDDDRLDRSHAYEFFLDFWHHYLKSTVDEMPSYKESMRDRFKKIFSNSKWYEKYNFLEFTSKHVTFIDSKKFNEHINETLEEELSAYRLLDGIFVRITEEQEIQSIDAALTTSSEMGLNAVKSHLSTALSLFSDKQKPDYRNSIKESISAVESIAKKISGNDKDSLGGALDKIKGKLKIHPSLEIGFKKIYGYTSDSDGIRHAMKEESSTDFEDAKFMLVSSSAFINYLIGKSIKAGIKLN